MPIYEYHCKKCGQDFEVMARVSQMRKTSKCRNCGATAQRKLAMFSVVRGSESSGFDLGGEMGGGMGDGHDHGDDLGMDDDFDF